MKWQKIANIAGPRGADGVDGETPDIEWQGTALSVNGAVGPDLRGPQGTPGDPGKDSTVPGPPGERGAPGPAPAIKIGTVTSGTTPSATITGTSPDLTLGLVLPKGDRGDKGETGAPGVVSSASSYVLVGPGRPDTPSTTGGVITGSEPVGAEYRSTDGANVGAWTWRKRPTGWAVTDGDTGWRKHPVVNGWSDTNNWGGFLIRRIGSTVSTGGMVGGSAATANQFAVLASGFNGPRLNVFATWQDSPNQWDRILVRGSSIEVDLGRGLVMPSCSWITADTWPTAPLPGTPA